MQKIFLKRSFYVCWLMLVLSGSLHAQFEEGRSVSLTDSISCAQTLPSAPGKVWWTSQGESSKKIRNIVRLKLNELAFGNTSPGSPFLYFKSGFLAKAYLKVEMWNTVPSGSTPADLIQHPMLQVNYDPAAGVKYDPITYIQLSSPGTYYEQVQVTIDSVNISGLSNGWTNTDALPLLSVGNEMDILRYYNSPVLQAPSSFTSNYDNVNHSDQLSVSWAFPDTSSFNMAQLEYGWVENESKAFYNVAGTFDPNKLLKTNSTRIDIDYSAGNLYNYNIPLLYPADSASGGGTLCYRVRAVQRKNDGSLIIGPWSTAQSYSFKGHEQKMNWQAATAFAENAKSNTVIQYFDGSLRPRQTVTKDNTTGNTTVAETIYDLQGRPNVQILPTPTISTSIQYFRDFNRFEGQNTNDNPAAYFDLAVAGNRCVGSPALKKDRGNGAYYSSNNPWIASEASAKLVPDANGYGYTETRYTDDPTARVSSQGGVGQSHQIGNGHETKYFYGKPSQQELDVMFGTDVGDASHYFKNMVQDANGQMSVSYVDMHGRTVATALAGGYPANMYPISSDAFYYPSGTNFTHELATPANNIVRGNSLESLSTLLLAASSTCNFSYSLTPAILSQMGCNGQQVCFDCKYDLEISIRPEGCTTGTAIIKHFSNLQMVAPNIACNSSMGFTGDGVSTPSSSINFSATLGVGSWVIRKTLSLNDSSFQMRRDSALKAFLCDTLEKIQQHIFDSLSTVTGCGIPAVTRNCSTCQAQLGDYSTYKTKYLASVGGTSTLSDSAIHGLYTQDSLACADACGLSLPAAMTSLGVLRNQMLNDMIPDSGQYAIPGVATNSLQSLYNILAASSTRGDIGVRPYYKNPLSETTGAPAAYANEDGTVDSTIYSSLGSLSTADFTKMFSRSWANQLIRYHPEYSKLHFAETTLAPCYSWLDNVQQCDSYDTALARGYLDPLNHDPYFTANANSGYVPTDKDTMSVYLTSRVNYNQPGISIWSIANNAALGDSTQPQILQMQTLLSADTNSLDSRVLTTAQKDAVWEAFRDQYLYYRNDMVVRYINVHESGTLSTPDMNTLIGEQKQLRFATTQCTVAQNGWTWWSTATNKNGVDSVGLATLANTFATPYKPDPCTGQRPFWQGKLMQCEQLQQFLLNQTHSDSIKVAAIINVILDSMVMVCHNSIDGGNPEGASSVNPSLSVNPRSFEDIINHVFQQNQIATLPGNNYFCNPYSVDYPKPFNSNPPLFANQAAYVDTCNCKQFGLVKAEAAGAGYDSSSQSSMNAYLLATYGDTLSLPLWQGLSLCGAFNFWPQGCVPRSGGGSGGAFLRIRPQNSVGGDSCFNYYARIALGTLVNIPAFLHCGYVRPCLTCTMLANYTDSFHVLYPAYDSVPYMGMVDTNQASQNALWARYLNFKTGFNLTVAEYIPAYISCKAGNAPDTLVLTDRATQAPEGTGPGLYLAKSIITFEQEYVSLDSDDFETSIDSGVVASAYALCDFTKPVTYPSPSDTSQVDPCQQTRDQANFLGELIYQQKKDSLIARFDSLYKSKCLSAQYAEVFNVNYFRTEYHYTLYYYDQAGNLIKTLPPGAVRLSSHPDSMAAARAAGIIRTNGNSIENFATQYRYNSLNQVIAQKSPDGGISHFWYDRLGRLAISQNAKQAADPSYSYTLYDPLGRITDVGQKPQTTGMSQTISQDTAALKSWLNDLISGGVKQQITRTIYDVAYPGFSGAAPVTQLNLRNRVAYTQVLDAENVPYRAATFYSYDKHGNVDTLVQDYDSISVMGAANNRFKLIKYDYDLISNKVNQVSYQPGQADAFYHQYSYDAQNRLVGVRTSRDSIQWEDDAAYQYYRHGPLARVELGSLQVQGVDYAYTLQGWLKSVNPSWTNDGTGDLYDTDGTGTNPLFERDAYKFNLHYFDDGTYTDYTPVSAPTGYIQGNTLPSASRFSLYNGNISSMAVNIRKLTASTPLIYSYRYDQLNRIRVMNAWKADGSFSPIGSSALQDYAEGYTYDPNGNIMTLSRNGTTGNLAMDNMSYQYAYIKSDGTVGEYVDPRNLSGTDQPTNRLSSIVDIPSTGYDDIKPQGPLHYKYDQIGNLINDSTSTITWSVYGKILTITNASGTITYAYDASGNRISKNFGGITTWYVRDVTGNVMATYVQGDNTKNGGVLTQTEAHLYGSSRLGILNLNVNCTDLGMPDSSGWVRGSKFFELTNHLGNVLATITDKKIQNSAGGTNVDYYTADVASASDYYPFGMQMPGRTFNSAGYRYGFNGKEKNDEISGPGNSIDFGNRMDDTRGGRWFSIDRITKPWLSPYAYAADNPVNNVDPDGKDEIHFHYYTNSVIGSDGKISGGPTTFRIEIIKANGPDRFFVHTRSDVIRMPTNYSHGGQSTQEKTVEIYPWNPDSRSGFTKSTLLGIPVKDRDYATLIKYATANPALKEYIKERSQGYEATNHDKENYKGLLEDLPVYNTIGKIKQGAEVAAGVLSIVEGGLALESGLNIARAGAKTEEFVTLYRSISKAEAESIQSTNGLSFAQGQMEVKQFWQTKEGLAAFNKTAFAGEYNLEITVPKSLLGNGKPLNTAVQVDEWAGPTATVDGAEQLSTVNQSISNIKITPIKR